MQQPIDMPRNAARTKDAKVNGARPFIKWVGGKRQLLSELLQRMPATFGTYLEPFVGGAALFFATAPAHAILADTNQRLVRTYIGLRDNVDSVITLLSGYRYDRDEFYRTRALEIDKGDDAEVAAWFIYLNRTGFNGLYRVNSRNIFNVPFGRYTNPLICDEANLRACSARLKGVEIRHEDFRQVAARAIAGDFVYFDPPYVPLSVSSNFTSYTAGGFGEQDQRDLANIARELKQRGVHVLLSNSDSPLVHEIYASDFRVERVAATRMVNSVASDRGAITEVVIY